LSKIEKHRYQEIGFIMEVRRFRGIGAISNAESKAVLNQENMILIMKRFFRLPKQGQA